jgi:hypothetical protein
VAWLWLFLWVVFGLQTGKGGSYGGREGWRSMSVLEKVARERVGISESPHIAHHEDWAEPPQAAAPSAEEVQKQWREGLEQAATGPRYAKRNMNLDGGKEPSGDRYEGTADPARPKTPPFAWGDDSGTVKTQELQKTHDTPETWAKNIEEAQSGPNFAKTQLLARNEDPGAGSASRSKHSVEASRNILAQHDDKPSGRGQAGATRGTTGDWAHTRGVKPAPYIATDPQWQNTEPMSSEFRHMGRAKEMTAEESQRFMDDAQPVHRFAKSHGDYHLKASSPMARAPEPERRASRSRLDELSQPKSARGGAPTPRERAAEKATAPAAASSDADVYAQWKTRTPKAKKQPPKQPAPQQSVQAPVPQPEPQPQQLSAPEEPVRQTQSPVRPEATEPVQQAAPTDATAPSFERVGGRGGPKQSHAGANVFNSSWGFGAEHGDRDVSSADRFTSANRQMMQSGITQSPQPKRSGSRTKQAWGEPAVASSPKPTQKIKYPKDDGKPWGVSHNREAMQSVADAASNFEPPAPAKDRVRDHLGSTFSLGDESQRADSDRARRATATRQAYQSPVASAARSPAPAMDRVRFTQLPPNSVFLYLCPGLCRSTSLHYLTAGDAPLGVVYQFRSSGT